MGIRPIRASRRWFTLIAVAAVPLLLSGLYAAVPGNAASTVPAGVQAATARTGHIAAGTVIHAATSNKPFVPTAAERAARARDMKLLDSLKKPPLGPHTSAANVATLKGPQTSPVHSNGPTTFTVFKDAAVPAACSGSCAQSAVNEPDTANSGKYIVQTSNWDIAYTSNGGASTPTWSYQNPYSLQAGFCCDQTVTYVPSRDRFVYEGLDLGSGSTEGITVATTRSTAPTSWCVYHFSAANFGGTAGDLLDYPKIAYSNNNIYLTWNHYNSSGSWVDTGLARLPIDPMAACAGVSYNYLTRTDNFTFGLTYGTSSLDTFYWVSNWYTTSSGSGTEERIYYWPENGTSYFFVDRPVTSYNFSGGSCASQDGKVTNWCTRLDPRWETAWISRAEYNAEANSAFGGDTILGVAITAGPGGGDPFPYVIYEYFKLNRQAFIQTSDTFNDGIRVRLRGLRAGRARIRGLHDVMGRRHGHRLKRRRLLPGRADPAPGQRQPGPAVGVRLQPVRQRQRQRMGRLHGHPAVRTRCGAVHHHRVGGQRQRGRRPPRGDLGTGQRVRLLPVQDVVAVTGAAEAG